MTDKITLTNLVNLQNETTAVNAINANNAAITTAFDNTMSRDGTVPNQMDANLDMNNNQILNLPTPATVNSPARLIDVMSNPTITVPPVSTSGAAVGLLNANKLDSGNNTYTGQLTFTGGVALEGNNALVGNNVFSGTNTFPTNTFWNNTRSPKTAAYTVLNADKFLTLGLGGLTFYTVTFTAPSGYDANFASLLVNEDTSRAKTISCSGLSSFLLWPGQSCMIFNENNVWKVFGKHQYWKLTGATTFYIDNVNGSDNNDGLVSGAGAFATIQHGVNTVSQSLDVNAFPVTLQVSDGTYTETVNLLPVRGVAAVGSHNELIISGNTVSLGNTVWNPSSGNAVHALSNPNAWRIQGFKFVCPSGGAIGAEYGGNVYIGNNNFGACAQFHVNSAYGSKVEFVDNYSITGGSGSSHIVTNFGGMILCSGNLTCSITGTPAFGAPFCESYDNSYINVQSITYSGSATGQRYVSITGGGIQTGGGGGNFFPGNVNGSSTAPGWYA